MKKQPGFTAKRQKHAVQAADILAAALEKRHLTKKVQEYSFFPQWQEIVGPEIARVAVPEKISRGRVLVLRVIDSVWAQELSLQKQEILDKLFAANTGAVIEDINFVSGNPKLKKK